MAPNRTCGDSVGSPSGPDKFKIPAGTATFQLSGLLDGGTDHLISAQNASTITIYKRGTNWWHSSFSLFYDDDDGKTWTVTVGRGEWESDPQ